MRRTLVIGSVLLGLALAAAEAPAQAQANPQQQLSVDLSKPMDCGAPPQAPPTVPAGETATAEDLRQARKAVTRYSNAVTQWLNCRDRRAQLVFQFMTEEQKKRWNEDLDQIHSQRVETERAMNKAIRAYNRALQQSGDGNTG